MMGSRASAAWLCLLCIGLAAAADTTLSFDEWNTCLGALDSLRGCSEDMGSHDLQQHCCIPFHALEGMNCFW